MTTQSAFIYTKLMAKIFGKFVVFFLSFVVFLFIVTPSFASTFYLSPGSANIPSGSIVYVTVGINTEGESINGVSAYLSYPSDKLEVVSLSFGSVFSIEAEKSYGGGSVRVSRGSISGFVGKGTIATIGFKGKAQGSGAVSFISGSGAARTSNSSDSLKLAASTGGIFTVGAPKPPGSITGTPVPGTTKQPILSSVKIENITTNSATIKWTTDEKSDSTIEYGLNKDEYILSQNDANLVTDHSVVLSGKVLTPGAIMYLRVKSKNAQGVEGIGSGLSFQLKGYTVAIQVLDQKNNPVADTEVFLYSDPLRSKTSASGEVVFTNVTAGKHLILAVLSLKNDKEKSIEIDVKESQETQKFILNIDTSDNLLLSTVLYVAILLFVITIILGIIIILKKRNRQPGQPQQASIS